MKGDLQFAGVPQHSEAQLGVLGGIPMMGASRFREAAARGLQHQAHGHVDLFQGRQLAPGEDAGIAVGEEAALLQDQRAHVVEILDRAVVSVLTEPAARSRVAALRPIAQNEKGLAAAQFLSPANDGENLVRVQVGRELIIGILPEGTVAATVAAEAGQGDEDFG